MEYLIKNGAGINEKSTEGFAPIHAAIAAKQTAILRFLLSHGADVGVTVKEGMTLVAWAALAGFAIRTGLVSPED